MVRYPKIALLGVNKGNVEEALERDIPFEFKDVSVSCLLRRPEIYQGVIADYKALGKNPEQIKYRLKRIKSDDNVVMVSRRNVSSLDCALYPSLGLVDAFYDNHNPSMTLSQTLNRFIDERRFHLEDVNIAVDGFGCVGRPLLDKLLMMENEGIFNVHLFSRSLSKAQHIGKLGKPIGYSSVRKVFSDPSRLFCYDSRADLIDSNPDIYIYCNSERFDFNTIAPDQREKLEEILLRESVEGIDEIGRELNKRKKKSKLKTNPFFIILSNPPEILASRLSLFYGYSSNKISTASDDRNRCAKLLAEWGKTSPSSYDVTVFGPHSSPMTNLNLIFREGERIDTKSESISKLIEQSLEKEMIGYGADVLQVGDFYDLALAVTDSIKDMTYFSYPKNLGYFFPVLDAYFFATPPHVDYRDLSLSFPVGRTGDQRSLKVRNFFKYVMGSEESGNLVAHARKQQYLALKKY